MPLHARGEKQVSAPVTSVDVRNPATEKGTVVRPGGVISRVGVPQYEDAPIGMGSLFRPNIRLAGGPAPVRAYIDELLPGILDGTIQPGKIFDATTNLDGVPAGYQDMDDRKSLKVLITS
jgi:threonine dehydrogenase-like Zn-dependent dehydrogenase